MKVVATVGTRAMTKGEAVKALLIPLEDSIVFPSMTVTLAVDVGDAEQVFLVPEHEGEYASVGVLADGSDRVRLPGGARAVSLSGGVRAVAGAASNDAEGRLWVEVEERPDEEPPRVKTAELEREYRATVEEILELRDAAPRVGAFLRSIQDAGTLADTAAY